MLDLKPGTVKRLRWHQPHRMHMQKHERVPRQVEEAVRDHNQVVIAAKHARFLRSGRCGQRRLSIVLKPDGKQLSVVTARAANQAERTLYQDNLEPDDENTETHPTLQNTQSRSAPLEYPSFC